MKPARTVERQSGQREGHGSGHGDRRAPVPAADQMLAVLHRDEAMRLATLWDGAARTVCGNRRSGNGLRGRRRG